MGASLTIKKKLKENEEVAFSFECTTKHCYDACDDEWRRSDVIIVIIVVVVVVVQKKSPKDETHRLRFKFLFKMIKYPSPFQYKRNYTNFSATDMQYCL